MNTPSDDSLRVLKHLAETGSPLSEDFQYNVQYVIDHLIAQPPQELRNELDSILSGEYCSQALSAMHEYRILDTLFPEFLTSYSYTFINDLDTACYTWWQIVLKNIDQVAPEKRLPLLFSGLYHKYSSLYSYYLLGIQARISIDVDRIKQAISSGFTQEFFEERSVVDTKRPLLIMIGGGEMYHSYDEYIEDFRTKVLFHKEKVGSWSSWLDKKLTPDVEVVRIPMPNKQNAHYREWKIQFEKFTLPEDRDIHITGHSLGGSFLLKYISEEKKDRFSSVHLVSSPCDSFGDAGGFGLPEDISILNSEKTYIYHAREDEIVEYAEFEKLSNKLPQAHAITVEDGGLKGHILKSQFSEILENLGNLL